MMLEHTRPTRCTLLRQSDNGHCSDLGYFGMTPRALGTAYCIHGCQSGPSRRDRDPPAGAGNLMTASSGKSESEMIAIDNP